MAQTFYDRIDERGGELGKIAVKEQDISLIPDNDLVKMLANFRTGGSDIARAQSDQITAELNKRKQRQLQVEQLALEESLRKRQPSPVAGQTDFEKFQAQQNAIADQQRASLGRVSEQTLSDTLRRIQEQSGSRRQQLVKEQTALGRAGSGVGEASIGKFDVASQQTLADAIARAGAARAEQEFALEGSLAERLARAREFGVTSGLQAEELGLRERLGGAEFGQRGLQFREGLGFNREELAEKQRQSGLANLLEERKLGESQRQFDLSRPKETGGGLADILGLIKTGVDVGTGLFGKGGSGGLFGKRATVA